MNRVLVGPIFFEDHPTNPKLKVGVCCGYQIVTGDHYYQGQLGFVVPEGGVIPEKILREMWLWNDETSKGRLGGKKGDRVKSREMDGIRSVALFYGSQGESWNSQWTTGQDITDEIGIKFT